MKKILIVDDNVSVRRSLSFIFDRNLYEIFEAKNGADAVKKAKENHPDLIIMDFKMPVLNGWEATKQIKQLPELKTLPVLGYTAYANDAHVASGLAAGCNEILMKPIDINAILEKVKEYLS